MKSSWKINNMTRSINIRSGMCIFLLLMFMTSISITNGQETLTPLKTVAIFPPGGNPIYNCGSSFGTISSVQWLINGTLLEDLSLTNVVTEFGELSRQGALVFRDISVESHNNTIIQCRATFNNGEAVDSNNSTLLLQGLLSAVGSFNATPIPLDSIISLTWTPPFSLDITDVDPDITGYCVSVVNSTSSLVIHSECGITDTQYNYTVSPNDVVCDIYTFTITPVNVVGNGTSASVTRGILPNGSTILQGQGSKDIKLVQDGVLITFNVSAPVCSGSVSLQDIYVSSYILGPIEVTPDNQDNSISVMIPGAGENLNQEFNATFTLINSAGSDASDIISISTFDVQDIQDDVIIDYIEDTEALGALLALMYLDQDDDIVCDQSIYAAIRRNETLPMGDPAITTTYMGLAYDVDQRNGLPNKTYPAVRRKVDIRNEMPSSGSASNCTVTYMNGTASVSCVDSTSSVSGYQVILLQQNGRNNLTVLTLRSGSQLTLSVPSGRYCILELPMKDNELIYSEVKYSREFIAEEDDTTQSSTINVLEVVNGPDVIGIIIGVVVILISTILIILIIVVIVATIKMKMKKKVENCESKAPPPASVELRSVNLHMEDQPPIYASLIPVALRRESVHTDSTNLSDEPLLETLSSDNAQDFSHDDTPLPPQNSSLFETPPPLSSCNLEPTTPPPLPPYSPPKEPENNSNVGAYKDNSTGLMAVKLHKVDADLMYSYIHAGSGAGMSGPDVSEVKYEEVTGSRNKHGQIYSFVLPNQTQPSFKHDGDETKVIYSELKKEENVQEVKELATPKDEEIKEGTVTGNHEGVKEGLATGGVKANQRDEAVETNQNNAVEQVTSDTDPVRHITTVMKYSTSFISVKLFSHGYADDVPDTSNTSDSIQCTEPNDPACPIAGELYSYAMLKPSVSKMPNQAYMCQGFADDAFDASKYAKPSDPGPILAATVSGNEVERDVNKLDTLINNQCNKNEILNKLEMFINKQYINKTGWHSVLEDDPGSMHGKDIIEEQELSSISTGDKMKLHTKEIVPLKSDQLVLVDGVDDDKKCVDLYPDIRLTPRSGVTWLGQPFSWIPVPLISIMLKWLSTHAPWLFLMKMGIPGSLVNMLCNMIVIPKVKMKVEEHMKSGCYTSVIN